MTIDTQKLRDALQKIPRQKWTKHRATVSIPETEDFAGLRLSISGLSKIYARALAGYIAAANPDVTAGLLEAIDAQATEIEAQRYRLDASDTSVASRDLEIERLRALLTTANRMIAEAEEFEGPDGMCSAVPLDLWNEFDEALRKL